MADERNREMEDARRGEEMPGAQSGAGTARDREMGREAEPLGDRGRGNHTWEPPEGEQGISNRPNDEETDEEDDGLESHGA